MSLYHSWKLQNDNHHSLENLGQTLFARKFLAQCCYFFNKTVDLASIAHLVNSVPEYKFEPNLGENHHLKFLTSHSQILNVWMIDVLSKNSQLDTNFAKVLRFSCLFKMSICLIATKQFCVTTQLISRSRNWIVL